MWATCLGELALLVNEGDDIHGFVGDHIQCILVVGELDVLPADVLQVVLFLLQLEDVAHEELLQVLVGKVDAELLETVSREANFNRHKVRQAWNWFRIGLNLPWSRLHSVSTPQSLNPNLDLTRKSATKKIKKSHFHQSNQPVYAKVLKSKDVQQANGTTHDVIVVAGRGSVYGGVDLVHNPHKQSTVNTL